MIPESRMALMSARISAFMCWSRALTPRAGTRLSCRVWRSGRDDGTGVVMVIRVPFFDGLGQGNTSPCSREGFPFQVSGSFGVEAGCRCWLNETADLDAPPVSWSHRGCDQSAEPVAERLFFPAAP